VGLSPQQLRRDAAHCRELADSQLDERVRLILTGMAEDLLRQAAELEAAQHMPPARSPQRA
jgi:hypothetical protein